jgi:hypothetical protein
LFLQKKLYLLRMGDVISIIDHMNSFNTMICQLFPMDIKTIEEEKCIDLLCSFLDSCDHLVMDIGSNKTTLICEYMVAYILLEEIRWNNMEVSTKDVLMVRGKLVDIDKGEFSSQRSKLKGRYKSPVQSMRRCWNVVKLGITRENKIQK